MIRITNDSKKKKGKYDSKHNASERCREYDLHVA